MYSCIHVYTCTVSDDTQMHVFINQYDILLLSVRQRVGHLEPHTASNNPTAARGNQLGVQRKLKYGRNLKKVSKDLSIGRLGGDA